MVRALDSAGIERSGIERAGSNPARDIVSWFLARHFTLTAPLFTQVNKWVLAISTLRGNISTDEYPIQGRVGILDPSCYGNRDKFRRNGQLHRRDNHSRRKMSLISKQIIRNFTA